MDLFISFRNLNFPEEISVEANKIIKLMDSLERKTLNIAFCGALKAGKSSLINALLGAKLLPVKTATATSVVTRLFYSEKTSAWVIKNNADGKPLKQSISVDEICSYILLKEKSTKTILTSGVKEVWVEIPHELLKAQINLIDTPGLDDDNVLTNITLKETDNMDLIVVVFSAAKFMSMSEKEILITLNEKLGGNLVFVINRMDDINDKESLIDAANYFLSEYGNRVIGFNNIFYTAAKDENPQIDEFDKWFKKLLMSDFRKNIAYVSRISIIRYEIYSLMKDISVFSNKCKINLDYIEKKSEEIMQSKKASLTKLIKETRQNISHYKINSMSFIDGKLLDNYKDKIEGLKQKSNWEETFFIDCKTIAIANINSLFSSIKLQIEKYLKGIPIKVPMQTSNKMLSEVVFPSAKADVSVSELALRAGLGLFSPIFIASNVLSGFISKSSRNEEAKKQCVNKAINIMSSSILPMVKSKTYEIFQNVEGDLNEHEKSIIFDSGYEEKIRKQLELINNLEEITKVCNELILKIEKEILEQ